MHLNLMLFYDLQLELSVSNPAAYREGLSRDASKSFEFIDYSQAIL